MAYCLGQRQDAAAIETLKAVLADSHEHSMYFTKLAAVWLLASSSQGGYIYAGYGMRLEKLLEQLGLPHA